MAATEIAEYPFQVRDPAKHLHITPNITTNSLMSTNKFAAANYITIFDNEEVNIYDANDTIIAVTRGAILRGWKCKITGLWRIPLVDMVRNNNTDTVIVNRPPTEFLPSRPPPIDAIHNVYELKTQPELVRYYHAAAGFPTKPTWTRAIKNKQFASWPGLTVDVVNRHYPDSEETPKGHGRKAPSGLRSTKDTATTPDESDEAFECDNIESPRPTKKERTIFYKVMHVHDEAALKIYTDQPGRFPKKSSRGNQYIMVMTEVDSDAILVEPMKNRTAGEMSRAYQALIDRLNSAGIFPKMHILDNECSAEMKATIKLNKMTFQLVPPHDHRRNIAEKAISTFKDHFIAILCGADKSFPLHLWDRLLLQAEHTLNMLRPARMTPTISAYAYLWKQHDYNANPFAPLGCKVEAHLVPTIRESWAPHTASGFYLGNAWDHYRCHEIYITDTRHARICNTVFFKHKYLTMPTITPADALIRAADNLTEALKGVIPPPNMTTEAVDQLMLIFKQQAKKANNDATAQRVLKELAQAERVHNEEIDSPASTSPIPELEVTYPATDDVQRQTTPIISQDDDISDTSGPAANTRSQQQACILTQEFLYHMRENLSPTNRRPHANIHYNSFATSHRPYLTMKLENYWNTGT